MMAISNNITRILTKPQLHTEHQAEVSHHIQNMKKKKKMGLVYVTMGTLHGWEDAKYL